MPIPRWAKGPFELLVQAELHFRGTTEQDRRLACILFDNAVEVSIVSYVHLHRSQRGGHAISDKDREEACKGFHSLLDFYYKDCTTRSRPAVGAHGDFVHFHRMRNEQYHGGTLTTPNAEDVKDLRDAAVTLFASLFEIADCEDELEARIELLSPPKPPPRSPVFDELIDQSNEPVEIGGLVFNASEVLYAVDSWAYREVGLELTSTELEVVSA